MIPFSNLLATTGDGVQRAEPGDDRWRVTTCLEGDVRSLAAAPGGAVLAGTQGDGMWRSDDEGRTWERSGLDGCIVKSIAICASAPDVVYAGTKPPLIYRSDDAGRTWRELGSFRGVRGRWFWRQPAERPSTPYVQALACSPTDPDVVVAGMEAGAVVITQDGGRTWSNHRDGACRDCHSLHFHPDGRHVYEAGGAVRKPGVAFSDDRGETWTRVDQGPDKNYGWAVAADPADPQRFFVSLSPGARQAHGSGTAEATIYRHDGGTWAALAGGLPRPLPNMPYALLTSPGQPRYVMAGLADGEVWHSSDSGDTWTLAPVRFEAVHRTLIGL